ncbi:hypothetical protein CWE13_07245 [Aliidiomarina shirensis]|uniref:Tetratricopeptide repeat-like domain-containing protein n=1 Tax=Aliidiomarina shirensis TaxID=1048642 RepID=A0A432WVD8_9GAMM|nr:hypothetical protein [Aliidiomarina shirensis]RUO37734.1 hypothetical protein CWE13_07245 [Aliidiomarina shirensis]
MLQVFLKNVRVSHLFVIALLWFGIATSANAQQQSFNFDHLDERFEPVVAALSENDHKAAEKALKQLRRSMGNTGDYHFLEGIVTVLSMNDASAIRLPFLARRMRNQWGEALEKDPDHELAHLSLLQFHANAPGIAGGDKDQVQFHAERLHELNSPFRFQADIIIAAVAEDFAAEEAAWLAWFQDQPENLDIRVNYISQRVNEEKYSEALTQMHYVLDNVSADDEEHQALAAQVSYQWGKLAAESGEELENGARHLQALLAENRVPENMPVGWTQYRLAQIYLHQGLVEEANAMKAEAQVNAENDENLKEALSKLPS